MKRKEIRLSASEGAVDPLVWLKNELLREGQEGKLPADLVNELEALALRIRKAATLRRPPSDDSALEALVEMLPSQSLTEDFLESVNERRKASSGANSPATALRQLRLRAGLSLDQAATCFGVTPGELERVEGESLSWYRLPAERLSTYAQMVRLPWASVVDLLQYTARKHLVRQVESRLRLALGRYDKLQTASKARLDAIQTALATVKEENQAANEFFRRAKGAVQRRC
jgi:transcriptional regulator with XRE-family HTH domain